MIILSLGYKKSPHLQAFLVLVIILRSRNLGELAFK